MSIYGKPVSSTGETVENVTELLEAYILNELSQLPDEIKESFATSEEAKTLLERGIISKKTIVRLNKTDDLSRRIKLAAFQAAKEHNDSLWDQLVKNRIKEKDLIEKIVQKYHTKATQSAKLGQRDYLKSNLGKNFMRPVSPVRVQ
jgi:hypothetical protein